MKRKAILSFVSVVLFLVSVLPVSTFSRAADSHGGSGVSGSQPAVRANSTNLTSNAPLSTPVMEEVNGTLVSTLDETWQNHWWDINFWTDPSGGHLPPQMDGQFVAASNTIGNLAYGTKWTLPFYWFDSILYLPLNVAYGSSSNNCVWFQFDIQFVEPGLGWPYPPSVEWYIWDIKGPGTNDGDYDSTSIGIAYNPGDLYSFSLITSGTNTVTFSIVDTTTGASWSKNDWVWTVLSLNMLYDTSMFSPASAVEGRTTNNQLTNVPYFQTKVGYGINNNWHNSPTAPSGIGTDVSLDSSGYYYWYMYDGIKRSLTVSSAHDSPVPSSGSHTYSDGSSVTCSVTSAVTEGSTVWICTDWSGSGSVPSSGSGTSVTFKITQDSSITWNWIVGALAYYSVEPVPISPLTDLNGSLNGLETPATPSPVNLNFNVEIHFKNATLTNIPAGVGGLEIHFHFGNILNYCQPLGFTNMLGEVGGVLVGPSILYGINAGFYDNADNLISAPPYTRATQYMVAASSTSGSWKGADGLVAEIAFQITGQPSSSQSDFYAPLQITYTDLTNANANSVPSYVIQGTVRIDASPVVPSYLVVRGADSWIYYRASLGISWGDWNVLPGATCDSPAATVYQDQLCIVVRGMDGNTLWYGKLTDPAAPTSFSGWTLLSGATPSAPTLTSNGTVLCLVVRGEDNSIYYRCYNGSWGSWFVVPTGATLDSPAASILGNNLHIVVRGMDGSSLWDIIVRCDGTIFRNWGLLSGATSSRPVLACSVADNLCLVVRGMDNAIYYRSYTGSTDSWGGWSALPTGATNDGPGATVMGNILCTVVRGMDGNTLWCAGVDLGTSSFTGWTLLSGATPSAPELASTGTTPP